MIYPKLEYERENELGKDRTIYYCHFPIVDMLPDDAWEEIKANTIECHLIAILDRSFGGGLLKDLVGVYKTTFPMFDSCQDGHGFSADIYMIRYVNDGETNLISYSASALIWMLKMMGAEKDFEIFMAKENEIEIK